MFAFVRDFYKISSGFFYTPPKAIRKRPLSGPLVSVIIPAWNEEIGIVRTVNSVIANTYWNTEVIIVDDGSTDKTKEVAQALAVKWSSHVRVISKKNGGKANALNTGITNAKGSLILTLDADSFLERDSIEKLVMALSNDKYSVAIGEVVVGNLKTWLGRAQHYEYTVGFHAKRSQHIFNSSYIFPGALTLFRKSVLDEVGEFTDYSSTEDLDISMRFKMAGHKIAYVDSAICVTEGASTVKGLLNQRTRWRHGYLECLLHHKTFFISRQKGSYLTLVDLPLQLLGVFEVLLFPFIVAILGYFVIIGSSPLILIAAYLLVPFTLILLAEVRDKYTHNKLWTLTVPFMLLFIACIEYVALLKSIYRTVRRKRTQWTVWQRTGASN